jgi:serine/threonine-protein kinase
MSLRDPPAGAVAPAPATLPKGLVQIDASPWAQVEVDGVGVGTAPPLNQLALPEGRHTLTLRHGELAPHSVIVEVAVGQPVVVKHSFEP